MKRLICFKKAAGLGVCAILMAGCLHRGQDPDQVDLKKPSEAHLKALQREGALPPPPPLPSPQSYGNQSQWAQGTYSHAAQDGANGAYNPPPAALEQSNTPGDTDIGSDPDNM